MRGIRVIQTEGDTSYTKTHLFMIIFMLEWGYMFKGVLSILQ